MCDHPGVAYAVPWVTRVLAAQPNALSTAGGERVVLVLNGNATTLEHPRVEYSSGNFTLHATNVALIGDTSVACTTVPGVGAGYAWRVIFGLAGGPASSDMTSYAPPVVLDAAGVNVSVLSKLGGEHVRITGRNFGPISLGIRPLVMMWPKAFPAAEFVSVLPSCVVSIDHVEITCMTARLDGDYNVFSVSVGGQVNQVASVRVELPVLTSVTVWAPDAGACVGGTPLALCTSAAGQSIVLNGTGFGVRVPPGLISVSATNSVGAVFETAACRVVANDTQIVCAGPHGFGVKLAWVVVVLGSASALPLATSVGYLPPSLDGSVELWVGTDGLSPLRVAGANFAFSNANVVVVLFDELPVSAIVLSDVLLSVSVPAGVGTAHTIRVTLPAFVSSNMLSVRYAAPAVSGAALVDIAGANFLVSISGSGFGTAETLGAYARRTSPASATLVITIGGAQCALDTASGAHSDTRLACWTSANSGAVAVSVAGQYSTESVMFQSGLRPSLTGVTGQGTAPMDGGGTVTFVGASLAQSAAANVVLLRVPSTANGSAPAAVCATAASLARVHLFADMCDNVTFSDVRVHCALGASNNATFSMVAVYVVLLHRGPYCIVSNSVVVAYAAPIVISSQPSLLRTNGSTVATFRGANFDAASMVYVSGEACAPVLLRSRHQVVCVAPAGSGTGVLLSITSTAAGGPGGPGVVQALTLTYVPPAITNVSSTALPRCIGGDTVRVVGSDFGTSPTVLIGGVLSPSVRSSRGDTLLEAIVPPGIGLRLDLTVLVGGQGFTVPGAVSYAAPKITSVVINGGTSNLSILDGMQGGVLTVAGENFGPVGAAVPTVALSQTSLAALYACDMVSRVSDGLLTCLAAARIPVGVSAVIVTVSAQSSLRSVNISVVCPSGSFGAAGEVCRPCVTGALCQGGAFDPIALVGYFRTKRAEFLPCTPSVACSAMGPLIKAIDDTYPAPFYNCGEGNQGWLCAECRANYYRSGLLCIQCPNDAWLLPAAFALLMLMMGFASVVMHRRNYNLRGITVGIDFLQV